MFAKVDTNFYNTKKTFKMTLDFYFFAKVAKFAKYGHTVGAIDPSETSHSRTTAASANNNHSFDAKNLGA